MEPTPISMNTKIGAMMACLRTCRKESAEKGNVVRTGAKIELAKLLNHWLDRAKSWMTS